jgi:hypothetical protein
MEMPFPHEAKKLQAGLDDHKSHAASNDAEGDIKKPEENNIFYVPEPFKTKWSHLFSPRIKLDNLVKSRSVPFYSATAFNSLSFGNTGRYLYAAENSSTPYPITAKATPHSCHVGR